MDCPRTGPSSLATARAMMSVPPPGAIGTTRSIDRVGQLADCACTQVAASNDALKRARPNLDFRLTRAMVVFMSFSLLNESVIKVSWLTGQPAWPYPDHRAAILGAAPSGTATWPNRGKQSRRCRPKEFCVRWVQTRRGNAAETSRRVRLRPTVQFHLLGKS